MKTGLLTKTGNIFNYSSMMFAILKKIMIFMCGKTTKWNMPLNYNKL